jgi:organizing structure protein 2
LTIILTAKSQRATAPLTATLLVSAIALYPTVSHADAPLHPSKRPIYDDYDSEPTTATLPGLAKPTTPQQTSTTSALTSLITGQSTTTTHESSSAHSRSPTPTDRLASQIRLARLWLYRRAAAAESGVDTLLSRLFAAEATAAGTIASLAPPPESGERLMPGAVYVLVSSMAGSIFVRNRGVLLRAAGPLGFGLGAAWTLLPVTMGNVSRLLWEYETKFPVVADAHVRTREGIERGVGFARVHSRIAAEMVDEKVREAREAVEGWVRKGK